MEIFDSILSRKRCPDSIVAQPLPAATPAVGSTDIRVIQSGSWPRQARNDGAQFLTPPDGAEAVWRTLSFIRLMAFGAVQRLTTGPLASHKEKPRNWRCVAGATSLLASLTRSRSPSNRRRKAAMTCPPQPNIDVQGVGIAHKGVPAFLQILGPEYFPSLSLTKNFPPWLMVHRVPSRCGSGRCLPFLLVRIRHSPPVLPTHCRPKPSPWLGPSACLD